jgi:excisionase family DNA binding protein
MPRGRIFLFAAACLGIALALALVTVIVVGSRDAAEPRVISTGQPDVGGPFQLVDQTGQPVTEAKLEGRWSLVFFGFTYCPDYCPATLAAIGGGGAANSAQGAVIETDILTIKEVAEYLRMTEKTAYRLASERKIPGFKVGGSWRFRKGEIDAWIDEDARKRAKGDKDT